MKWIVCGKNNAAASCVEFLAERGDEVWAIGVASDDGRDGWQRSLRRSAEASELLFEQPRRLNRKAMIARLIEFAPHVLISIQYDQILSANLLRTVDFPCLNLHFSLLPRHRGVSPAAFTLLDGDSAAGVTLHHMAAMIDEGDIIAQQSRNLDPNVTARELYDQLSELAVQSFRRWAPRLDQLMSIRLPQDPTHASYHRVADFDFSQRKIDWTRPADELHRWMRAMIFPPFQHPETTYNEASLVVTAVGPTRVGPPVGQPGEIIACSDQSLLVATGSGSITISGLARADGEDRIEVPLGQLGRGDVLGRDFAEIGQS